MSNHSSLDALRKKEEEDKKGQEYYAGGHDARSGGGSGLSVYDPPDSDGNGSGSNNDIMDKIVRDAMKAANENGNNGGGDNDSSNSERTTLTLYRNGFVVNDGPLRELTDPANQEFMRILVSGGVPPELASSADPVNRSLNVNLSDKRGEDFTPPAPPAYVAFSGEVHTLGGNDNVEINESSIFNFSTVSDTTPTIDESKPTTTIQVRLNNGKKIRIKLNYTSTIADLLALIKVQQGSSSSNFTLSAGFPPKDIVGTTSTIEEAGLIGAAVTQK